MPAEIRLFADWPEETHYGHAVQWQSAQVTVDQLPVALTVATKYEQLGQGWVPATIDSIITFDENYTWDWHYRVYPLVPPGLPVDVADPTFNWVATSYAPVVDPAELSMQRVSEVYDRFEGLYWAEDLGTRAATWVGLSGGSPAKLTWSLYRFWWGLAEDVWCMMCQGQQQVWNLTTHAYETYTNPADCITGCELAVQALHLVGVAARVACLHPRPEVGVATDWERAIQCWAVDADNEPIHPDSTNVGFWAGGFNKFEATFLVTSVGKYWAWAPQIFAKPHPYDVYQALGVTDAYCHWLADLDGDGVADPEDYVSNGPGHVLVTAGGGQ
ncbi:MAG: hypothetical protein GF320_04950 [Armatimonadia bacterium]|nr:hypothetical protein [Armatimonadia bacterium]